MPNTGKDPDRLDTALADGDKVEELVRRLMLLAKQGGQNKLPGAASDHSFLYTDQGTPD